MDIWLKIKTNSFDLCAISSVKACIVSSLHWSYQIFSHWTDHLALQRAALADTSIEIIDIIKTLRLKTVKLKIVSNC